MDCTGVFSFPPVFFPLGFSSLSFFSSFFLSSFFSVPFYFFACSSCHQGMLDAFFFLPYLRHCCARNTIAAAVKERGVCTDCRVGGQLKGE